MPGSAPDELKQRLYEIWHGMQQTVKSIIDIATEWRNRLTFCVTAKGGNFEHIERDCDSDCSEVRGCCHGRFILEFLLTELLT